MQQASPKYTHQGQGGHEGSVAASISLSREHILADLTGAPTKAKGHTILSLDEFLYQFDAGKHDAGILERVKAEQGRSAELNSAVILLNGLITGSSAILVNVARLKTIS